MSSSVIMEKITELAEILNVEVIIDKYGAELNAPSGYKMNTTDLHCALLNGEKVKKALVLKEALIELEAGISKCECEDCVYIGLVK